MHRIVLFAEDYGHEAFIVALVKRLAGESKVDIEIISRSVTGGHGKVVSELQLFLRELDSGKIDTPDLLIVVTELPTQTVRDTENANGR